ncbi:MAG: GAF domain-containing protein [Prochlorothrix sp.]|nr:GAF domain-containing protein [Prochlorothrix sp.]
MSAPSSLSPTLDSTQLQQLQSEALKLRQAQRAYEANQELLKGAVRLAHTTKSQFLMKSTLQHVLRVVNQLAGAESSSLFLIDKSGVFLESILARGPVIQEMKQNLIGQVLDQGLAGWAYRNQRIGCVSDTKTDDRWIQLSNQPYETRSALAIPLMRSKVVLGILTLMHSEANYFTDEVADQVLLCRETVTCLIENANLLVVR